MRRFFKSQHSRSRGPLVPELLTNGWQYAARAEAHFTDMGHPRLQKCDKY